MSEILEHPTIKASVAELLKLRDKFDAGAVSAKIGFEPIDHDGEKVPVTIKITVGHDEDDESVPFVDENE